MTCDEALEQLSAYVDGELDAAALGSMRSHLEGCAACRAAEARLVGLSEAIREELPRYRVPESLRRSVQPVRKPARIAWPSLALGTALGAVAMGLILVRPQEDPFVGVLVDDHVRSLMGSHLMDVVSTDRHTVKPWFLGKVDFAPSVPDLKERGFPLVGGRLEYIGGHAAAALVYRRKLHVINVFVMPHVERGSSSMDLRGFHVVRWRLGDLDYWAVSDVEAGDLQEFAQSFRASVRAGLGQSGGNKLD